MRSAKDEQSEMLERFIEIYCTAHHDSREEILCAECRDLLDYAYIRLEKCPYDPKPKCKDCKTHCYKSQYRVRIKEVMRISGMHFTKRR